MEGEYGQGAKGLIDRHTRVSDERLCLSSSASLAKSSFCDSSRCFSACKRCSSPEGNLRLCFFSSTCHHCSNRALG
eukprot:689264-Amphidinium_carterae.1